jgi:predicted nucleic acid-binding protein
MAQAGQNFRNILSAYDAIYVFLAEALDAPPLTRDKTSRRFAGPPGWDQVGVKPPWCFG